MTVAEQADRTRVRKDAVHTRALIIGSGFSGLGMAIALQRQGVDFLVLEKADEIGGTWRDNTYPGCACDIPAHMYSFSFEPKPDWRHMWSFQPEIFDYLKGVDREVRPAPLRPVRRSGRSRALGRRRAELARIHRRPGRSTSRSSSSLARADCTSRSSPTSRASTNFSRRRFPFRAVGPHVSTSPASGSR